MKKSILLSALIFSSLLSGRTVHADPADAGKSAGKQIVCDIWTEDDDTGDDYKLANLTISLDSSGIASTLHLVRLLDSSKSSPFLPSKLDLSIDNTTGFISHGVRPGRMLGVDSGKPYYDWGASRIEFVKAVDQKGNTIAISINDHKYSGHPGSTVTYKVDGTSYSAGVSAVSCDGAVKLPMVF